MELCSLLKRPCIKTIWVTALKYFKKFIDIDLETIKINARVKQGRAQDFGKWVESKASWLKALQVRWRSAERAAVATAPGNLLCFLRAKVQGEEI